MVALQSHCWGLGGGWVGAVGCVGAGGWVGAEWVLGWRQPGPNEAGPACPVILHLCLLKLPTPAYMVPSSPLTLELSPPRNSPGSCQKTPGMARPTHPPAVVGLGKRSAKFQNNNF